MSRTVEKLGNCSGARRSLVVLVVVELRRAYYCIRKYKINYVINTARVRETDSPKGEKGTRTCGRGDTGGGGAL